MKAIRITGPDARDLSTLPVKIAAQLARHVHNTPAAAVITNVHHIILHPHIVRATFGHRVLRDFARLIDISYVDNMNDAADGSAFGRLEIEEPGKDLIADENVIAIA